ncbi:hypothetical protein Tsubulata_046931 [Turnera subulata]|uniref:C3H1-type domain-containing protein n=1 Tax=Turnera subulata TaxID=218843 RepID=A0A9Q0JEC8_9ROSI|nr:hypothetical protein Tsubulata_046931 [Turnera subulata]
MVSHSTPLASVSTLPPNSPVGVSICDFKLSSPSDERFTMQMEVSCMKYEDPKSISGTYSVVASEKENLESEVNEKDNEVLITKDSNDERCEPHSDSVDNVGNCEVAPTETINPSGIIGNELSTAIPMGPGLGDKANAVLHSKQEVKPLNLNSEDAKEETASRSIASQIRTRSLSPSAEFMDGNKRPAIVCDFFVKGWCIRGSSCRFLHVKDKADNSLKLEECAPAENLTGEGQFDEGARKEESKLSAFHEPMASSSGKDAISRHSSFERIRSQELRESKSLHQFDEQCSFSSHQKEDMSWKQFSSFKEVPGSSSSFKDLEIDNHRQNLPDSNERKLAFTGCDSPLFQNGFLPDHRTFLGGSVVTSTSYRSQNSSSYLSSLDDLARNRGVHISSLDTPLSTNGMLPSQPISTRTGPSFSFTSFLNTSQVSQKLSESDRDYGASRSSLILRSASPFSGAEPGNLYLAGASGDQRRPVEHLAKHSSNNWEPSIPFQPTFFITPVMISSLGSQQYDPLRDSFDASNLRDKSFKFSFLGQGISTLDETHKQSLQNQTHGADCNGDKSSVSVHNETVPKEESASGTDHNKGIPITKRINVDHDASHRRRDGSRHKQDLMRDRVGQNNDIEVDQKTDGNMQKDSKGLRQFRSALVELVKELLKPSWREGRLSKDAHNVIVKKASDKVIGTLLSHQVPTTTELISQYLSTAQPKIAKLVEGYVTKYGKP